MAASTTTDPDGYSPLYFLSSLGAGGLAVTFFMWLMHWTPHPGKSVPVFEDIAKAFEAGDLAMRAMLLLAVAGIVYYAVLNIKLLVWNLQRYRAWKGGGEHAKLIASNGETQLLALPLALGMNVNVLFILGLVLVPGLWSVVEYLFPAAIVVFLAIGVMVLRMLGRFYVRVLTAGGFNCAANNSFAQALPAFALAMVGVGLAAPAGLSSVAPISGAGLVLSTFFLVATALTGATALLLGLRSLLEHGADIETAPTLSVFIPVLTIVAILSLRQGHGLHEHFALDSGAGDRLMALSQFLSAQLLFGLFAGAILNKLGYAKRFVTGPESSPGSYALVCPGVALVVMLQFWLNRGLADAGLVAKFSFAYWALTAPGLALQFATMWLVFMLNRKHFRKPKHGC
ncbi:hypothetical protein SAMN04488503_0962 [Humidesulfovibrio mexicanus]|uniref:Voltage-dependent anion channel n=1 Tax=Humidesulfovibrio mexicanus TaxID=147047 RepID=A0A238YUI3_9BACT|nr:hypothetical protein [Humidesulfovibrio mexicanus]SNR74099.1 hypothetical protein SAMN04488503_0962 [Humidesulfovibrio mexicanus]